MEEAPVRQYQLEFAIPEETFLQNVKLGEETIDDMERRLNEGEDVRDILRKYKVPFILFLHGLLELIASVMAEIIFRSQPCQSFSVVVY